MHHPVLSIRLPARVCIVASLIGKLDQSCRSPLYPSGHSFDLLRTNLPQVMHSCRLAHACLLKQNAAQAVQGTDLGVASDALELEGSNAPHLNPQWLRWEGLTLCIAGGPL